MATTATHGTEEKLNHLINYEFDIAIESYHTMAGKQQNTELFPAGSQLCDKNLKPRLQNIPSMSLQCSLPNSTQEFLLI